MNNKPLNKFKGSAHKGIEVTIWPTRNGGYSFKLRKSYKPKDSAEWKETNSYFSDEIEELVALLNQAKEWVAHMATDKPSPHEESKANGYQPEPNDDNIPF